MKHKCVLCEEDDDKSNLCEVRRGLQTIISHLQLLGYNETSESIKNETLVHVHNDCRKQLNNRVRDLLRGIQ